MLEEVSQLLDECEATAEQRKWVVARLYSRTDKGASKAIGIHPNSVYRWPNKAQLDKAVEQLLAEPVVAAVAILQEAAPEAAATLRAELAGKNAVSAANSILDRIGVNATQKHEVTGKDGQELVVHIVRKED